MTKAEQQKIERLGETNYNTKGKKITIIEYNRFNDILVEVEDEGIVHTQYHMFKKGNVGKGVYNNQSKMKEHYSKTRIGEENFNFFNNKMKIIEYNSANDIIVEFNNGYRVSTQYRLFSLGQVRSPYDKSVFNIGYLGEGKYKYYDEKTNKSTITYQYWHSMMQRCYDTKELKRDRGATYQDCTVSEEWHNFQNFAKWWNENYYNVNNELMTLDKDILHKNNKIYSPNNCIFVPIRINTLFIRQIKNRGIYPIGVGKENNGFKARCSILDENGKKKRIYIGHGKTVFEAFEKYKQFKENYIKQVADKYKELIPKKLYDAIYNWKIEITD